MARCTINQHRPTHCGLQRHGCWEWRCAVSCSHAPIRNKTVITAWLLQSQTKETDRSITTVCRNMKFGRWKCTQCLDQTSDSKAIQVQHTLWMDIMQRCLSGQIQSTEDCPPPENVYLLVNKTHEVKDSELDRGCLLPQMGKPAMTSQQDNDGHSCRAK